MLFFSIAFPMFSDSIASDKHNGDIETTKVNTSSNAIHNNVNRYKIRYIVLLDILQYYYQHRSSYLEMKRSVVVLILVIMHCLLNKQ